MLAVTPQRPHRSGKVAAALGMLLLAAAGYGGWWWTHRANPASGAASAAHADAAAAVPVTVDQARKADFPVYLTGLGTVQPFDTVTVRSRVDGEVVRVDFHEGQPIRQGDTLLQIDPRPYQAALDQAVAKKAQDEATLRNDQLDLQRYQGLSKDVASRQQIDTQQALVNQVAAQIKGDQASIDSAQVQLNYTTIKAPLAGVTGFRLIDPGNIVHASDLGGVVTIVRLQPISVVFTASEDQIPVIRHAMAAGQVPVQAFSSDGSQRLADGTLTLINNQVDQASGTISMKATFANDDNALWPGLSVSTQVLVNTLKGVVTVPDTAVQRGPDGPYAFIVGPDNKAHVRKLKVAQEGHGFSVIGDGVAAGETVVTAGQYRLTDGTGVKAGTASADIGQNTAEGIR